jgi:hypothetical protein
MKTTGISNKAFQELIGKPVILSCGNEKFTGKIIKIHHVGGHPEVANLI